ncbi:DNA-directed RNA polymerase, omega subunit [Oribacterium parvum ACB1]|uniref:DNA-directed RNA polymerase subunit omega n=1 Tax=Oribacterium parvum ACB1 TaxID=796943 RepID=G9WMS1_9FIRM|nr:DNA-directed RNA polymerase subunit omega [Oribacterium parvum]EHL11824.1 DNA-directed RNA polymerase, omega subunit [Oribacterium parvum ACB1]EJF13623.1 DNA-directed RNA polymerase, omega subunit [Oribacterium parvum ACB8]
MLRPTYNDLIDSMNKNREEGELEVQSRYSVVIASAKRARQIIDGDAPLVKAEEDRKPLSIAIEEISKNLVNVEKGLDYEEEPMNPTTEVEDYSRYALDDDLDDEEEVDLDSEAENDDYLQEDGEEDDYSDGDYSSDSEE